MFNIECEDTAQGKIVGDQPEKQEKNVLENLGRESQGEQEKLTKAAEHCDKYYSFFLYRQQR